MMYDPLSELISKIKKVGFVNAHAHLDRAYTVTEEDFKESLVESHLFKKWELIDKLKRESSEEDYLKAIDIFFSLKNSYETKIKNEKKNMKKRAVNKKDYLNLFKEYQPKCVNCKAYGGTIFKITKDYYLAECSAEKKCNLNIKIKRGEFLTTNDYSHQVKQELNKIKTDIITINYRFLIIDN